MPKGIKNLVTEDIKTDELLTDTAIEVVPAQTIKTLVPNTEDEERFFPLLGIRCKVSEADRLLAEQAEQQAE